MKIEIKYSGSIINLPASVLDYLPNAKESELKVLLGIFNHSHAFSSFDSAIFLLSESLGLTTLEVTDALKSWARVGVISVDGLDSTGKTVASIESAEKNSMPTYTGKQIASFIENNKEIETLFLSCQAVLGKSFNTPDYNSVIFLKDYYKFSDDYILLLLAHCVECEKTGWAYIRKTAKNLYDEGIDSYDLLEKHFAGRKNKRSLEYKIRNLFEIGERELSKKERELFDRLFSFKVKFELIRLAYDVTIDKTHTPSLSYTAKVIENWLSNGIKTVEDAQEAISSYKSKLSLSSFDADEFFESALKRSNEKIMKGHDK